MKLAKIVEWSGGSNAMRSDAFTACFIAAVSGLAQVTSIPLLLFPELAALSFDVFRRPKGAWAKAPLMLILTPFLAGLVGTLICRNLDYGPLSVLLAVFSAILVMRMLRSPIAPAVSAGLLPLTLGLTSWWYAPSLLVGTSLLVGISMLRARLYPLPAETASPGVAVKTISDLAERDLSWMPFFVGFLAVASCVAAFIDMQFFLFPPLVVVAYEMFAHFEECPWVTRPFLIPILCGLSALATLLIVSWLGMGPLSVALAMLCAVTIMRVFNLYFPPSIAVGMLPFVMPHFDYHYPVVVTVAALLFCFTFVLWRKTTGRHRKSHASA